MKKYASALSMMFLILGIGLTAQVYRVSTVPTYINNNGQSSVAFNITTGSKSVNIKELGCWINSGASTVTVYYKTSAINESSSWTAGSNFTQLSSQTATGTGTGPVAVAQNLSLLIPANTSYGFIVHSSNSLGYMTWNSSYPTVISDGTVQLECAGTAGWGGAYPSMSFNPRSFLGYVDYGFGTGHNDAGIAGITNPGIPVCQAYSDSMVIEISNDGLKDIDSVMLGWQINDTIMPPIHWKGRIPSTQTAPATLHFFRNLQNGDTLKAWTYQPNGVQDSFNLNDTLIFVFIQGLNGVYTVGDNTMDFATLDSAVGELNRRGVCGPVTFRLKDTTHVWRGTIQSFHGQSAGRPVKFVSMSGDTSLCKIQYQSISSSDRYVLTINGGAHLYFDSLSITNMAGGSNAGVINLTGDCHDISFSYCRLGNNYTSTNLNAALITSPASNGGAQLSFSHCTFVRGSAALWITGETKNNRFTGITVGNCTFQEQGLHGLALSNVSDLILSRNNLTSSSTANGKAFSIQGTGGMVQIDNNKIISTSNWPRTALFITGSAGMLNTPNLILNNVFKLADTSSSSEYNGIVLDTTGFYLVAHNTIALEGTDNGSSALSIANSGGNSVYNNVFANLGTGKAIKYSGTGSILGSDFNNIYSKGLELAENSGTAEIDLAAWQSATGFDLNSVSSNPGFNSRSDLHPCGAQTDNIGTPISQVFADIDGVQRDPNHPDPGAYEFASPLKFNLGNQFNICNGDTFTISPSVSVNDLLVWNNTDTSFVFQTTQAATVYVENIGQCGIGRDTFTVVINPVVALPVDTNICFGDTLTLMSNISGSIKWDDGSLSSVKNVAVAGRYSLEVTDTNGCYSADTIYVTRSLAVSLPADTTICEGVTVHLDPKTGAGTYNWSNGSTAPVIFVDSTGNYSLTFTDVLGCSSSGSTKVTVLPQPKGGFTTVQGQSNLEFTANDTTATTYYWSFGDGQGKADYFRTVHTYAANGSYKVRLTVTNSCGTITYDSTLEVGTIGFLEPIAHSGCLVYPNPAKGLLSVVSSSVITSYSILDIRGREVTTQNLSTGVQKITIPTHRLIPGTYVLRLRTFNGVETHRVVVQ